MKIKFIYLQLASIIWKANKTFETKKVNRKITLQYKIIFCHLIKYNNLIYTYYAIKIVSHKKYKKIFLSCFK